MQSVKVVVVGDGAVGKTCMLIRYTSNEFPTEYIPTVFDTYSTNLMVEGSTINLKLWDTAGQEDYDRLRPLSYNETNVFIMCYSIDSEVSYTNAGSKWKQEIHHYCPQVPIILAATKVDLRKVQPEAVLSKEKGEQLQKQVGAKKFVECSAQTGENLKQVFDEAVKVVIKPEKDKTGGSKRKCIVL